MIELECPPQPGIWRCKSRAEEIPANSALHFVIELRSIQWSPRQPRKKMRRLRPLFNGSEDLSD